ncbi:MAG: cell division protein FtsZ [Chloroflexi bacterium]|nr:cell division protein FtsZ [Chloroflexota bacterium]
MMIASINSPFEEEINFNQPQNEINTEFSIKKPVLKVIGLGGGGCNAISRMMELGFHGVEFIAANTDHQALNNIPAPVKIQLGPRVTRGLGAGGDPAIGKAAAQESAKEIADALAGADMVFLTAGMGGGTGTGSIPVAAEIARQIGAVAIAVVTTPFSFEMGRRQKNSAEGLAQLQAQTNTLIAIPNDRLLYVAPKNLPIETAFRLADDVLRQAVQGITELITEPGLINVDFSHIRRLMMMGGGSFMAIGHGYGENKSQQAIEQALNHPLLETVSLDHASGIIANFTGGPDLTLYEVESALTYLQNQTGSQSEIVMGVINDDQMMGRVQVILVVTGIVSPSLETTISRPAIKEAATVKVENAPVPKLAEALPVGAYNLERLQEFPEPTNLDLPAFLRKRVKYDG